jgi:hypothetical protein
VEIKHCSRSLAFSPILHDSKKCSIGKGSSGMRALFVY